MADVKKKTDNASLNKDDLNYITNQYHILLDDVTKKCIGNEIKAEAVNKIIFRVQDALVNMLLKEV